MSLSVVTITYNDPEGLKHTLDSLQPLAHSDIEWKNIIIDSSPVVTQPVLDQLPGGWPMEYHLVAKRGVFAAQNEGIDRVSGKWVWFLNGGDWLKDFNILKKILNFFKEDSSLELVCAGADLYKDGKYLYPLSPVQPFFKNLIGMNGLCHQGLVYKQSALKRVGGFLGNPFWIAADYEHHVRCYAAGVKTLCIPDRLVGYDMSGQSTNWKIALKEFAAIGKKHRAAFTWSQYVMHVVGVRYHFVRIFLMKFLGRFYIGKPLRALWLRWQRLSINPQK